MKMRIIGLIGIILSTVQLGAQLPGITETGATVSMNDNARKNLPVGSKIWVNTIQNLSGKEIEAIHVTFECTTAKGKVHSDDNGSMDSIYVISRDHPIPTGQVYVAKVIGEGECSGSTDAIVFANGETEGDADKIAVIMERRKGAFKALDIIIPLMDQVASGKMKATDLIALLEEKTKALSSEKSLTVNEIGGESFAFGAAISVLQSPNGWLVTPSDNTADKQPRFTDIMVQKGISLEQARATVHASKFREWRAALKSRAGTSWPE